MMQCKPHQIFSNYQQLSFVVQATQKAEAGSNKSQARPGNKARPQTGQGYSTNLYLKPKILINKTFLNLGLKDLIFASELPKMLRGELFQNVYTNIKFP